MDFALLDPVRYALAAILVVILPVVAAFWFVIHGGISVWKQRPAWQAYWTAFAVIVITLAVTLVNLSALTGEDLGRYPGVFVAGAVIYFSSWWLSSRIRSHLNFRTFAGVPEVKNEASALIESGPFAAVRHPRYFMILVGTVGWCLAANYAGAYLMALAFTAALLMIIRLEERELVARFGAAYEAYRTRVPALFPRPSHLGKLIA